MPKRQTRRQFLTRLGLGTLGVLGASVVERLGVAAQSLVPTGVISGTVTEAVTSLPLAGVLLEAGSASTLSDKDGRYRIVLPPGTWDVHASVQGYIGMTAAGILTSSGMTTTCDIELLPEHPPAALAEAFAERLLATAGSGAPSDKMGALIATTTIPATIRVVTNYVNPSPEGWVPNVVTMELEEYLRGVVPYEMSAGSPKEALKAQAVAARSYAAAGSNHYPYADVCTTTHCQYRGSTYYDTTDQAVSATRGIVVTYGGYIAQTFYFGHCIGQTHNSEDIEWAYVPWCRQVTCDPCAAKNAAGNPEYKDYWGHGVGMCQEGAKGYASAPYNWNYSQILHHYYTGIELLGAPLSIAITSPADGAAVRGVVLMTVSTSLTLDYIDFYLDPGVILLTRVTSAPWQMRFNTTTVGDGWYKLRAVAVSGEQTSEASVNIRIDNTAPEGSAAAPSGWLNSSHVPIALTWNSDAKTVQFSNAWRWEGEALYHAKGQLQPDIKASSGYAWLGTVADGPDNTWYGPYTCALPLAAQYQAYFRLKANNSPSTAPLAKLDVADSSGQRVLSERTLYAEDLAVDMTYEEFMLPFAYTDRAGTCAAADMHDGLEFRVDYLASRDLYYDCVTVYSAPQALAPTITWDANYVNGEQTIWVRLLDAAGNATDFILTVKLDLTLPSITQQGRNAALAQDTVSGLDQASARWSDSTDGGVTWSDWQPFEDDVCTIGTVMPVLLTAPAGAADDVRYLIRDMAGNTAFTRGIPTELPLVFK